MSDREMRNQSGEILRRVAEGESVQVTKRGEVSALIVPPSSDPLNELIGRGQARPARSPITALRSIARRSSDTGSAAIVADVRGRW